MKLTAAAGVLADALGRAVLALDERVAVPILGTVILRAADGAVLISATNLDRQIATTAEATVERTGTMAVPGKRLAALVEGFARDAIVMLTEQPARLNIQCGRSIYRLPRLPFEDAPAPLAVGDATCHVTLTRDDALRLFAPAYAAAMDQRPYLAGVFLHAVAGRLTAVATDGVVLVRVAVEVPLPTDTRGVIVPSSAVGPLARLLRKLQADARVTLAWSPQVVEVAATDFAFAAKLIDWTFPAYERIVPAASENFVIVGRSDLQRALTRLAVTINPQVKVPGVVGLSWSAGRAGVRLSLPRQSGDADDEIAADEVAGQGEVALSISRLTEISGELPGDRVRLDHGGVGAAAVITDPSDHDLLVALAPIRWDAADAAAAA